MSKNMSQNNTLMPPEAGEGEAEPACPSVDVTNPVSLHLQQRNSVLNKGQHLPSVMYASWQMPEYFNNNKKKSSHSGNFSLSYSGRRCSPALSVPHPAAPTEGCRPHWSTLLCAPPCGSTESDRRPALAAGLLGTTACSSSSAHPPWGQSLACSGLPSSLSAWGWGYCQRSKQGGRLETNSSGFWSPAWGPAESRRSEQISMRGALAGPGTSSSVEDWHRASVTHTQRDWRRWGGGEAQSRWSENTAEDSTGPSLLNYKHMTEN